MVHSKEYGQRNKLTMFYATRSSNKTRTNTDENRLGSTFSGIKKCILRPIFEQLLTQPVLTSNHGHRLLFSCMSLYVRSAVITKHNQNAGDSAILSLYNANGCGMTATRMRTTCTRKKQKKKSEIQYHHLGLGIRRSPPPLPLLSQYIRPFDNAVELFEQVLQSVSIFCKTEIAPRL